MFLFSRLFLLPTLGTYYCLFCSGNKPFLFFVLVPSSYAHFTKVLHFYLFCWYLVALPSSLHVLRGLLAVQFQQEATSQFPLS